MRLRGAPASENRQTLRSGLEDAHDGLEALGSATARSGDQAMATRRRSSVVLAELLDAAGRRTRTARRRCELAASVPVISGAAHGDRRSVDPDVGSAHPVDIDPYLPVTVAAMFTEPKWVPPIARTRPVIQRATQEPPVSAAARRLPDQRSRVTETSDSGPLPTADQCHRRYDPLVLFAPLFLGVLLLAMFFFFFAPAVFLAALVLAPF